MSASVLEVMRVLTANVRNDPWSGWLFLDTCNLYCIACLASWQASVNLSKHHTFGCSFTWLAWLLLHLDSWRVQSQVLIRCWSSNHEIVCRRSCRSVFTMRLTIILAHAIRVLLTSSSVDTLLHNMKGPCFLTFRWWNQAQKLSEHLTCSHLRSRI